MRSEELLEYLKDNCWGKKRALPSTILERELCISRKRLQKQVNRLRRQGHPIASSQTGYFYAETAGDIYSTIKRLRIMVKALETVIHALEECLEKFGKVVKDAGS